MTVALEVPVDQAGVVVERIPIDQLIPAKDNPRKDIGDVAELAASIKAVGLLEPIVVMPQHGDYLVVCGARRLAGAKVAGLKAVDAIVREFDEHERQEAMLIENLQRTDLTALEEAGAYQRLVELGYTQRQLAERLGRSQGHVSKRLALLELPAKARAALDSGRITIEDGLELSKLSAMPKRLAVALKNGLEVHNIPRAVKSQLEEHERAEKRGRLVQELTQAGVPVVKLSGWNDDPPKGHARVRRHGWGGDVDMDPEKHAKEPCHAVAFDTFDRPIEICSSPGRHRSGSASTATPDEKEARAKERQRELAERDKAWQRNLMLGEALRTELAKPKITADSMRLLAELALEYFGDDLGMAGFRFVDEESQTIILKKDNSISRVEHLKTITDCRALVRRRLDEAKTAEQIMGVLLQGLLAAEYADGNAIQKSQRGGWIRGLSHYYASVREPTIKTLVHKIAEPILPASFTRKGKR